MAIPIILLKLIFYQARLKIFFKPCETYHERKLVDCAAQPQSFWLHLMVKNKGYEISKNTEAYLSKIWIQQTNKFWAKSCTKFDDFMSPVKLKWAHEADIYPIDILPKEQRRLDVCYIIEKDDILHIMTKGFASGTVKNILLPGSYVFAIRIVSENSPFLAKFLFSINWDGKWKTLKGSKYVQPFRLYRRLVKSFVNY
ncbi:MAG: hypothetical protein ABIG90_01685 [bacterium]